MMKSIIKKKSNLICAVMLGICLSFGSSVTTFAQSKNSQVIKSQVQSPDTEKALLEKQKEIDKYVFEQHSKEIEQKGFKVTHTAPLKELLK